MKYHMRRKDRELNNPTEIESILSRGKYAILALCRNNEPYIVTLSYGYDHIGKRLYMHCASEGLKLEFIKENPVVCGTVVIDNGYVDGECEHAYESVVFRGSIGIVDGIDEKKHGMKVMLTRLEAEPNPIMERCLSDDKAYGGVTVLRIDIEEITGKKGR